MMVMLTRSQLNTITIELFKEEYGHGLEMNFSTDFSFDVLEEADVSELYGSADVFRQGSCELFALALHRRFGYKVYHRSSIGHHWFCKVNKNDKEYFVDVRGIFDDEEDFIATLDYQYMENYIIEEYDATQDIPINEIDKLGLAFAEWIIQKNEDRYKI